MPIKKDKAASKEVLLWKYRDHPEFARWKKIKKADDLRDELKKLGLDIGYHKEDNQKAKEAKKSRKVKDVPAAVVMAQEIIEIAKPNHKKLLIERAHRMNMENATNLEIPKTLSELKKHVGESIAKEVEAEFKRLDAEFKAHHKKQAASKDEETAVAMVRMADLPDGWPPSPSEYEDDGKKKKTEKQIEAVLAKHKITKGLPRGKESKKKLFTKKRCTGDVNPCSEEELCDLNINLCVDKTEKVNNANKMDKEMINGKSYYGTAEARALVKDALLAPVSPPIGGGVEESKREAPSLPVLEEHQEVVEKPDVISPININRLLDKSSEEDIRKTILNCLGLYHEIINPNDEIVMRGI